MKEFMLLLLKTMEEPKAFGSFHLIAIACTILFAFFLCLFFRDANNRTYRVILALVWAAMVVTEVLAEMVLSVSISEEGVLSWQYQWSFFPLQLCDTPLYFLLPIAFLKEGKLRDALSAYMCSFILLGGIIAYAFPSTIFGARVFLNVRTSLHHGLQIAVCAFIGAYNRRRLSLKSFLPSLVVFLISVAFITAFNVGMHALYPDQYINMFYISPYYRRTVPFLNDAFQQMSAVGVIFLYLSVVSALSFVVYLVYRLVVRLLSSGAKREGNGRGA